ncbi:MAG: FABP family protein [Proteobacteria bacterium]|nr:FABP family protein [Pseudomonadota bacterium]
MSKFPPALFAEPDPDPDTLANLGPLRALAGVWEGKKGTDVKPTEDGGASQRYVERWEAQPIDPQMNGPQLLYGLRYHTHIVKPGEVEMYHDQVGYLLWEPATGTIMQTLAIPRGQSALAVGKARKGAKRFTLRAVRGSCANGIASGPFLEENFRTDRWTITYTVHDDGSWSYDQTTVLKIKGVGKAFRHTDANRLKLVKKPSRNPVAKAARKAAKKASEG